VQELDPHRSHEHGRAEPPPGGNPQAAGQPIGAAAAYLAACRTILERIAAQADVIEQASQVCAQAILADGLVHLFGSGHSRIPVEEMFPRYGSFAGFHPIVELSLTNHHQVVGANGQRQAMFLENVEGFGEVILSNFHFGPHDAAIVFSHGGTGAVSVEVALGFKRRGLPVIAVTSLRHSRQSASRHSSGRRLFEVADIVIDNGAEPGDAMVRIPGLPTPVGPGSTIGSCLVVNMIKCRVAELLTAAGKPPAVITSPLHVGVEESRRLFDAAYEEHWRRTRRI